MMIHTSILICERFIRDMVSLHQLRDRLLSEFISFTNLSLAVRRLSGAVLDLLVFAMLLVVARELFYSGQDTSISELLLGRDVKSFLLQGGVLFLTTLVGVLFAKRGFLQRSTTLSGLTIVIVVGNAIFNQGTPSAVLFSIVVITLSSFAGYRAALLIRRSRKSRSHSNPGK